MSPATSRHNGGPAKAGANRAAIVAAGRAVFRERGYSVPYSAVAKRAGVSQAVLYRHFPSKQALAMEIFAENFEALDASVQSAEGPGAFFAVWETFVEEIVESTAIIEFVIAERVDLPEDLGGRRLEAVFGGALKEAQEAGLVDPDWTMSDLLLITRMLHGVMIAADDRQQALAHVARALQLIDPRLARRHRFKEES